MCYKQIKYEFGFYKQSGRFTLWSAGGALLREKETN